jgi:hypothetical protein
MGDTMTAPGAWTTYSTIAPLLGTLPGWVPALDKQRIASYTKYDQIYWSAEEGFQEIMRGDNENPVFLPTARTLVNTLDRYTCPKFTYRVEGDDATANQIAQIAFDKLFKREKFTSLFNSFKHDGGKDGDALLHVVADLNKPLGKRISLYTVDPSTYFPVYDVEDPKRIVKVHLAELVTEGGKELVSRLTYEKVTDEATGKSVIFRSHALFKTDNWWDLETPERVVLAEEQLDPLIQSIPVYHYKNGDPTQPFGSSDLRGLESVFADISQAASDESLTLAMEGLGLYATDGAGPVNERGEETEYITGPGRVLTHANGLRRINGVGSVTPYGDHIDRLEDSAYGSVGASDVALGKDTSAEAGIALQIRLGPIMATTGKKDDELVELMGQFFYDLQFWLQVYEELPMLAPVEGDLVPKATVVPVVGQKMPVNLTEVIKNVVDLRNCVPPVISVRTSLSLLRAAGMAIPEDEEAQLLKETQASMDALLEPSGDEEIADDARVDAELEGVV